MRRQSLGEKGLLIILSESSHSGASKLLRLRDSALFKQYLGARIINLCDVGFIFETSKERLCAVKMIVSLSEFLDCAEEETSIIFNVSLITCVPGLLEMEACSREFNQCLVYIVPSALRCAKIFQHNAESDVKSSFDRMIGDSFEKRLSLNIYAKCVVLSLSCVFNDSESK